MAEIIFKSGIKRDKGLLYWARPDGIYGKKLKRAGESAGRETKIVSHGQNLDYSKYMYFVVGDDLSLARSARQVGGSKRKKAVKKAAPKKAVKKAAKKAAPKKAAKKAVKKAAPKKAVKKAVKKGKKK
ncbi:MAG: hypothetical protein R2939_01805 [Kofleriaceae bacterium]